MPFGDVDFEGIVGFGVIQRQSSGGIREKKQGHREGRPSGSSEMKNIIHELKEEESQLRQAQKEHGFHRMKNIVDVLKEKESQLRQVQTEVEALKLTMRLLEDITPIETANPRLVGLGTAAEPKLKDGTSGFPSPKSFP